MKIFTIPVQVEAYTEEEAKAKVEMLVAVGTFLLDLDVDYLARTIIKAHWLGAAGKIAEEKANATFRQLQTVWEHTGQPPVVAE